MKPELQEKLTKDYPKIFANKDKTPRESAMAFGISTGDGWYWIINHLCRALQERTDDFGEPQIVASQVKEKFGTLRFYVNSASEEQYSLIRFTEMLSGSVCEECGTMADVSLRKGGWIVTLCDPCDGKRKDG
jgi:hypothetical protein